MNPVNIQSQFVWGQRKQIEVVEDAVVQISLMPEYLLSMVAVNPE